MTDQLLIKGLTERNEEVFDFVFKYYYSGLCAYANKFLNDSHKSEDIVQDLFVSVWNGRGIENINNSLKSYLFISVKNRCLDLIKHEKVKDTYRQKILKDYSDYQDDDFNIFIKSELESIIKESLKKLPPRCREIFELSRFKGKTNNEIANKLDISKRTVELQISNAIKILRVELKDYLPLLLYLIYNK